MNIHVSQTLFRRFSLLSLRKPPVFPPSFQRAIFLLATIVISVGYVFAPMVSLFFEFSLGVSSIVACYCYFGLFTGMDSFSVSLFTLSLSLSLFLSNLLIYLLSFSLFLSTSHSLSLTHIAAVYLLFPEFPMEHDVVYPSPLQGVLSLPSHPPAHLVLYASHFGFSFFLCFFESSVPFFFILHYSFHLVDALLLLGFFSAVFVISQSDQAVFFCCTRLAERSLAISSFLLISVSLLAECLSPSLPLSLFALFPFALGLGPSLAMTNSLLARISPHKESPSSPSLPLFLSLLSRAVCYFVTSALMDAYGGLVMMAAGSVTAACLCVLNVLYDVSCVIESPPPPSLQTP
jgi:hypothetical protein